MEKKTLEYYMDLPYTVELEFDEERYSVRVKELPRCTISGSASDSLEKISRLLEDAKRKWIESALGRGKEVPEPSATTVDPFWEEFLEQFPHGGFFEQHDVK